MVGAIACRRQETQRIALGWFEGLIGGKGTLLIALISIGYHTWPTNDYHIFNVLSLHKCITQTIILFWMMSICIIVDEDKHASKM